MACMHRHQHHTSHAAIRWHHGFDKRKDKTSESGKPFIHHIATLRYNFRSFISIKRNCKRRKHKLFIDKSLVTWLPLGMLTLRVLRASPYLHFSSPASSSFRDSTFLSFLPPFLSAFIILKSTASRGKSWIVSEIRRHHFPSNSRYSSSPI